MQENKKFLAMLEVVVPPTTPLTVTAEINILEILGIVATHEMLAAMQITLAVVPQGTPATLYGLVALLGNIIKMHPKVTKAHLEALSKAVKALTTTPDSPLTFGTFLPICQTLMQAMGQPVHRVAKQ